MEASLACVLAVIIRQIGEYREWLVDHPNADWQAVREIRRRLARLEADKAEILANNNNPNTK